MQRPYGTNYAWVCLCRKQASATTIKLALQNCTWTVTQTHTHLKKFDRFKSQKSPRTHTLNKAYYNNSVTATEGRYTHTHTQKNMLQFHLTYLSPRNVHFPETSVRSSRCWQEGKTSTKQSWQHIKNLPWIKEYKTGIYAIPCIIIIQSDHNACIILLLIWLII